MFVSVRTAIMLPRFRRVAISPLHALGFIILAVIWWLVAEQLGPARLPTPLVVGQRLFSVLTESPRIAAQGGGSDGMWPHLVASIVRVLVGGTIGMALGVGTGLLMGWSRPIRELLEAPIEIIRAVPPLALAPFLLLWFGPTVATQLGMLTIYMFLIMVVNTAEAIRNTPSVQVQYAQTLGAGRARIYRTIVLPSIVPELVGAIRVGLALSWGIAVVVELLGAREGIGVVFSSMLTTQGLDVIIIGIFYVTIAALLMDQLILRVSDLSTRWVSRT